MNGPKVVVIGAGSYFFGRPAIWNMINSEILRTGTLALVDTDPGVLKVMMTIAEKAIEEADSPVQLIGSTDRKDVLKGADFVVLTFSYRNAHFRGIDTEISKKYGITMCSSDTIGPGGIFRALREIPKALDVARDMENLCPDGWLINFINPTSVLGIALMRNTKIKSFALCDGNHEPHSRLSYLKFMDILPEDATSIPPEVDAKVDLRIGGINHCTWIVKCDYDGKDMLPNLRNWLVKQAEEEAKTPNKKAKPRYNMNYALQLFDIYGAYPTAISHTKEYVPFFQGYGVTPVEPEPIIPFDAAIRTEEMDAFWKVNEQFASGEKPIRDFLDEGRCDHATDIIESMWGDLKKPFFINAANNGGVTNMPDDAFLELRRDISMDGIITQHFGDMPRGVLGLQHQVLDTHELTAEAAVSCDRSLLFKAMVTDPIVNNIGDAKSIMEELLEAEKEILPSKWY